MVLYQSQMFLMLGILIITPNRVNFVKILTEIISHLTDCLYCSFIRGILSDFQIFLLAEQFSVLYTKQNFPRLCVFSYIRPPLFYRIICLVENLIILQDVGNVKHYFSFHFKLLSTFIFHQIVRTGLAFAPDCSLVSQYFSFSSFFRSLSSSW